MARAVRAAGRLTGLARGVRWDPSDHPRNPTNGRFVHKGSPEHAAWNRHRVGLAHERVQTQHEQRQRGPEGRQRWTSLLSDQMAPSGEVLEPEPETGGSQRERVVRGLRAASSRDAGRALVAGLSRNDLRGVAEDLGIAYRANATRPELQRLVVQHSVGARLDSEAIRRPDTPGRHFGREIDTGVGEVFTGGEAPGRAGAQPPGGTTTVETGNTVRVSDTVSFEVRKSAGGIGWDVIRNEQTKQSRVANLARQNQAMDRAREAAAAETRQTETTIRGGDGRDYQISQGSDGRWRVTDPQTGETVSTGSDRSSAEVGLHSRIRAANQPLVERRDPLEGVRDEDILRAADESIERRGERLSRRNAFTGQRVTVVTRGGEEISGTLAGWGSSTLYLNPDGGKRRAFHPSTVEVYKTPEGLPSVRPAAAAPAGRPAGLPSNARPVKDRDGNTIGYSAKTTREGIRQDPQSATTLGTGFKRNEWILYDKNGRKVDRVFDSGDVQHALERKLR